MTRSPDGQEMVMATMLKLQLNTPPAVTRGTQVNLH